MESQSYQRQSSVEFIYQFVEMLCCDYLRASPIEAVYVNIIIIKKSVVTGSCGSFIEDRGPGVNRVQYNIRGYPGATDPWRCPNHRTVLQDFNTTSGRDPRLGSQERRSLQNVEVRRSSLSRWSGISPFRLRDIWPLGKTLPRLLCIDDEAGGGVPRYPRSGYQHVLAPENLRYSAQDYGGGDFSQSWTSELWTLP